MSFSPPVFNISTKLWLPGHFPFSDPFDWASPGQLYVNNRIQTVIVALRSEYIRWPTTIYSAWGFPFPINGGIVGIDDSLGNPWYYKIEWWEYAHLGFPNEYVSVAVAQCNDHGTLPDTNR